MRRIILRKDWSRTPLGPIGSWPQTLRTAVGMCLATRFPMFIYWGPERVQLYNDAGIPIMGAMHPQGALGPLREVFPDLWPALAPMFEDIARTGRANWSESQHMSIVRNGFLEEVYFTWSYSPVRDDSGAVVGFYTPAVETTGQVLGQRRLNTLHSITNRASGAASPEEASRAALTALAENPADLPFVLLYLTDEAGTRASLVGACGLEPQRSGVPEQIALRESSSDGTSWLLGPVARSRQATVVDDVTPWLTALPEPTGMGAPRSAMVLPLAYANGGRLLGFLVIGLSPRLPLAGAYRSFLELAAGAVTTAVSSAQVQQETRERVEKLAAIDKAKTAFFSNVSHEFRTPLTLMLGPTENALASPEQALRGEDLQRVYRNELRLLKLVNTLLDLSRLEAGRTQGRFKPTELAALTAGLANIFEPLMARAGLRLVVECPPLPEPVWVDPDMWEKVVLNLVSNAFKYTLAGQVAVRLMWWGARVELAVQDTGTGIALDQQPRIFERFHRVEGARGRSDEGTGIGLSLVRELVELHGGGVRVESAPGQGSTFTVSVPTGRSHLPPERVIDEPPRVSTDTGSAAFLQEAEQWLGPVSEGAEELDLQPSPAGVPQGHVLLVDDNADMRDYMARLLAHRFRVEAVADGWAALAAARAHPPDAVVADVMMPGLDGFGLVRELKADARTEHVPIMIISARASETATLEGFSAGIVDYMVKPFRARELLARTEAIVRTAQAQAESRRLLREVEAARGRLSGLIDNAPAFVAALVGPQHVFQLVNSPYQQLVGEGRALLGLPVQEALPEVVPQGFIGLLDRVYETGEPFIGREVPVQLRRWEGAALEEAFVNFLYQPRYDASGQLEGIDAFGFDVTEQVRAREQLRERMDFEQKLMGIVSHDLRNPLSAILRATSLMARSEGLDARLTQSLVRIQSVAERAVRMVRDLLDFTQARLGGGLKIDPHPMNIHQMVRGVVEEVELVYSTRVVEVKHDGDGEVRWDADRISQMMQNLVTNALKYSPEDSRVSIVTRVEREEVLLSVSNQGKPIPADRLASIFEPMQRATQEIDKVGRSVGLGLYIVERIVDAHGGRIHVVSTPEDGTRFTVRLPRRVSSER